MSKDDPVAMLARIQRDHRQHVSAGFPAPGVCVSRCADSQPRWPCGAYRAAAAAAAALAHHAEAVIEDMPDPFRYCKTCSGHPAWPCPEVRAITAALAGKEAGDAST
jgi:hypothetical protein